LAQTVRHRDFFLPEETEQTAADAAAELHAERPTKREAGVSLALLAASLVAVVGLAKATSPLIKDAVHGAGLPETVVAVTIALLVLLPESISALRSARRGRIQTSLNLAYGSTMASIGLTIPVIAVISLIFGLDLALGLSASDTVLLVLTLVVATLTVVPGRSILLQGVVHLSIFAAFLVLAFNP
jgi:Ca2+:H+ antiporter